MRIHFFTAEFPFGKSEAIISNELTILSEKFEEIIIYPFNIENKNNKRETPQNTPINRLKLNEKLKLNLKDIILIGSILSYEFYHTSNKLFFIKNIRTWTSLLRKAISHAHSFEKNRNYLNSEIFYSYWMNDWALMLMILKKQKKINRFVFRCGGFDIWDDRNKGNYLPFRSIIYKYADGIYPNSRIAEKYLTQKVKSKVKISNKYLGTRDFGINQLEKRNIFTIVSCSFVSPLKRIDFIIEIIKELDFPIKWIHIGDGADFESIKRKSTDIDSKHKIMLLGYLKSEEIMRIYQTESINLFLSVSETESLPVSMQEAISFGIPLMGTDVGGVSEIICENTGILVSSETNSKAFAQLIKEFSESEMNSIAFREKVRNYWFENFYYEKVYTDFAQELKEVFLIK